MMIMMIITNYIIIIIIIINCNWIVNRWQWLYSLLLQETDIHRVKAAVYRSHKNV